MSGTIGFRDNQLRVQSLELEQKKMKYDIWPYYASAFGSKLCSAYGWLAATTATYFKSTAFSCPRTLAFKNNMAGAAERKVKVLVKGYTAAGEYVEESLTLSSNATGLASTNNAFAHVVSVVPAVATKGYGTYGSVTLRPGHKIGLTEYCEDVNDLLNIMVGTSKGMVGSNFMVASATLFSKTYQTLNVYASKGFLLGSTVGLIYRSKFQKPSEKR